MIPMPQDGMVVVLGATGLLGKTFAELLGENGLKLDRESVDMARSERAASQLEQAVGAHRVRAVINCAAYTRVDQAESEAALAMAVNGISPGVIAGWCRQMDIPFIHFSSDYVFPGTGSLAWREEDAAMPVNVYGQSKAEGDRRIAEEGGRWLIFRPTWVYGRYGKSFFTVMLERAKGQDVFRVVNDQIGAPTYAVQFAKAVLSGLERALALSNFPAGVYHLCHAGETTWYDFCCAIIAAARTREYPLKVKEILPVSTASFGAAAARPANSRLNTDKANRILGLCLPDWKIGFDACVREML